MTRTGRGHLPMDLSMKAVIAIAGSAQIYFASRLRLAIDRPASRTRFGESMIYDAFISYARKPDGSLAAALREALHRFAKRTFELRAMRVFLDNASLDVAGALPDRLKDSLSQSRYLIVFVSPEA